MAKVTRTQAKKDLKINPKTARGIVEALYCTAYKDDKEVGTLKTKNRQELNDFVDTQRNKGANNFELDAKLFYPADDMVHAKIQPDYFAIANKDTKFEFVTQSTDGEPKQNPKYALNRPNED